MNHVRTRPKNSPVSKNASPRPTSPPPPPPPFVPYHDASRANNWIVKPWNSHQFLCNLKTVLGLLFSMFSFKLKLKWKATWNIFPKGLIFSFVLHQTVISHLKNFYNPLTDYQGNTQSDLLKRHLWVSMAVGGLSCCSTTFVVFIVILLLLQTPAQTGEIHLLASCSI